MAGSWEWDVVEGVGDGGGRGGVNALGAMRLNRAYSKLVRFSREFGHDGK